ncbi:arylsulfotransferase family protein [Amycolatopsis anabasis]|uniref:arylsulfotransferase family protein n=1 Tax=Amycolatopsis anabasis TaxID=1840409 RepID=UPI00131DA83F|nr:arylsulfotransferase family protein [Amycolatopsis anabasis]
MTNGEIGRRSLFRGAGILGLAAATGFTGGGTASAAGAPRMTVRLAKPGVAPGRIFFTYTNASGGGGVEIADAAGEPLWSTSAADLYYENFQQQTYRGRKVLTWWQGTGNPANGGTGNGIGVLTGLDHTPVATVGPSGDFHPDVHEFRITPWNTALITCYVPVRRDLSSVGGPVDGLVLDSYCEEVDIASGAVLLRWSALDHVPLTDSYKPLPATPDQPWDFFHANSISLTPDNHLLVSGRSTCALYQVHRTTGAVIWRLGGKSSSFALTPDAVFGWQHHAIFEDPRTIRLFDNASDGTTTLHPTRVAWLRLDPRGMTASLARSMSIPGSHVTAMGSAQRLPGGNVFVNWGMTPRLSEFSPDGDLLFDATLPTPSYRAFKFP